MGFFSSLFNRGSGNTVAFSSPPTRVLPPSSSSSSSKLTVMATMTTSSTTTSTTGDDEQRKILDDRLRGALWGFFAGDALSAPTHWYYGGLQQIKSDYGGPIQTYTKPNFNLAGSILNKSDLNGGGRSKSSGGSWFGGSANDKDSTKSIIGHVINHGKQDLWSPTKQVHYHATLQKGENTLEASIARVLMKSIVATGGKFDEDHFRRSYVDFMMTPNSHNDTYASTCHRMFFANLVFRQLDPKQCPDNDSHNVDTMDGLVLPTIVALAGAKNLNDASAIAAAAASCASVTRKSKILERVSAAWSNVVVAALSTDSDFVQEFNDFAKQTTSRLPDPAVRDSSTMSACYLSSALPGLMDMIAKYNVVDDHRNGRANNNHVQKATNQVWEGLLANANVGGENVHRGSVMGAILGARAGYRALQPQLVDGLYPHDELEKEIDDFVKAVLSQPSSD